MFQYAAAAHAYVSLAIVTTQTGVIEIAYIRMRGEAMNIIAALCADSIERV
jgi:hypothetical protein